jgi:streptothricin acetyltransferase
MPDVAIRRLISADVPRLSEIDAEFESDRFLDVEKTVNGLQVSWRLIERPLVPPFRSTDYGMSPQDCKDLTARLHEGDGLYLVAEDAGKLVALFDMQRERWRNTAKLWNIGIDRAYRRTGLGRELMNRAIAWARDEGLRGIVLETQTNNMPACRFYQAMGFKLCGIDDHFYSNDDIGVKEVAIFWWYELDTLR